MQTTQDSNKIIRKPGRMSPSTASVLARLPEDRLFFGFLLGEGKFERSECFSPLPAAQSDIQKLREQLCKVGYQKEHITYVVQHCTKKFVMQELGNFVKMVNKHRITRSVLLYFATHGFFHENKYHLALYDTIKMINTVENSITLDELLEKLTPINAASVLLIFDSCQENFDGKTSIQEKMKEYLQKLNAENWIIWNAVEKGGRAKEVQQIGTTESESLFVTSFLSELCNPSSHHGIYINAVDIFRQIEARMLSSKSEQLKQTPEQTLFGSTDIIIGKYASNLVNMQKKESTLKYFYLGAIILFFIFFVSIFFIDQRITTKQSLYQCQDCPHPHRISKGNFEKCRRCVKDEYETHQKYKQMNHEFSVSSFFWDCNEKFFVDIGQHCSHQCEHNYRYFCLSYLNEKFHENEHDITYREASQLPRCKALVTSERILHVFQHNYKKITNSDAHKACFGILKTSEVKR